MPGLILQQAGIHIKIQETAIVEVVVFCFFVGYKCCRLYFKQEKYVPAYLNEAIEESEKNNDDKEGKILIQNYVDVIHKTF